MNGNGIQNKKIRGNCWIVVVERRSSKVPSPHLFTGRSSTNYQGQVCKLSTVQYSTGLCSLRPLQVLNGYFLLDGLLDEGLDGDFVRYCSSPISMASMGNHAISIQVIA